MKDKDRHTRLVYMLFVVVLVVAELVIFTLVEDTFVNSYVNKVLIIMFLYCLVRVFIPRKIRLLPLYVFLFVCMIELLQYKLGLSPNPVMKAFTPSVWVDILCYAIGTAINSISIFKK
ncbi:hypothetical protein FACS1894123_06610 [Bacteroidia bacterium]|nr:hypothetical protein FACS1894123_06610 [Bacteroidia bacterium]